MPNGTTEGVVAEVILAERKKTMTNTMQNGKISPCCNNFSVGLPFFSNSL
jgi:hypothetical protein